MSSPDANHHDADLMLKCYDLRREAVMRESRNAVAKFFPQKYEDIVAVMQPDHPMNAAFRQVATYWEMVYSMVRHGIVHPEFFVENSAEGLFVFAKIEPYLEQIRKDFNPAALQNAEWVANNTEAGKAAMVRIKAYIQKLAQQANNQ